MTLVALFAMTTGAWAQTTFGVKEITADMVPATWNGDETMVTPQDMAALGIDFVEVTQAEAKAWADYPKEGYVALLHTYTSSFYSVDWDGGNYFDTAANYRRTDIYSYANNSGFKIFITVGPKVTWDAAAKQATFDMPASDVVLTPLYAPVAAWAEVESVKLLPTAAEGIFAGTTDPIIVEGTVATAGTTENPQGLVMYAVTSTNQATAPELSAFSATVPTAENIADEGADVLVWYYIQGADTPDGQEATAENTFNDSEICATPLEVSVLSNKFDITFNAANANTIENGKATVTVGGTAATVTEGKLEGVKMGSEVKMTAKQGYKFRKVEAKKPAAAVTTAPTAKTGVKAGQNEAIVNAGTAEDGTMMYAVTTDATTAPTLTAFSATVPTAEGLTAGTYYVWYYVKADDSHSDSEISATGIEVTIAVAYTMPAAVTNTDKDKLICTDGHIHAYGEDPECTATRVAKIFYIGDTGHATYAHGLALALTDEGRMVWDTAISTCNKKNTSTPVTGATWLLASKDQWSNMTTAAGSTAALRDGFSSVGGSNLAKGFYWSSTEKDDTHGWVYDAASASPWLSGMKSNQTIRVRACLAF